MVLFRLGQHSARIVQLSIIGCELVIKNCCICRAWTRATYTRLKIIALQPHPPTDALQRVKTYTMPTTSTLSEQVCNELNSSKGTVWINLPHCWVDASLTINVTTFSAFSPCRIEVLFLKLSKHSNHRNFLQGALYFKRQGRLYNLFIPLLCI